MAKAAAENATRATDVASQRRLYLDDGASAEVTLAHATPTTHEVASLASASITVARQPNQIPTRNDQSTVMEIASASVTSARGSTPLTANSGAATAPTFRETKPTANWRSMFYRC